MPKVSIVMPTHNRPDMLQEAVDSALAQTFQDFEIIVVLNGSPTEAVAAAHRLVGNPRLKVVEMADSTLAASRNFGMGFAQGEWLAFLDDDDIWLPDKLEAQLEAAQRTGSGLVTCNFSIFNQDGALASPGLTALPAGLDFAEALMLGNYVSGGSAVIVKTDAIRSLGGFDATLRGVEDWDMWRRLSWDNRFHYVDRVLVRYRRHRTNMTGSLPLALQAETQHFAKLLTDTPPKLQHMMPAAKRRYFRSVLHNLTAQGDLDRYDVLAYNFGFSAYRMLNKATGGVSRRLYHGIRGLLRAHS